VPAPRTRLVLVAALCALALAPLPGAGAVEAEGLLATRCAADAAAAGRLVAGQVVDAPVRATAAGLPIAVVTDPAVPPGIPHALLDTPAGLCTTEAFNLTAAADLQGPAALASAFASTAGMPWLGAVEVRDVRVAGGTVELTTVGGRHGVTSRWTVAVDGRGIRSATFETVAFGADVRLDDVHALEGITSLPGNTRTWTRDALGLLHVDATVADDLAASRAGRGAAAANAARVAGLAPGQLLQDQVAGQVVRITLGVVAPGVEAVPTGQDLADRLLYVHRGMGRIYDQYETWGATDVWGATSRTYLGTSTVVPDPIGYINFNSGLSEVCLACAFLGDFVEIHVNLAFAELTEGPLLGVSYPDDNSYTLEVVGHEFTHAVQGGYGDGNVGLTNAFTEATATASQALFHEAENSAQRGSIEFLDTANGCEGFENGRGGWIRAQAQGPFVGGHTYDACYFWWTYVAQHGGEGLVRLMEALPGVRGKGAAAIDRHLLQLDLASPTDDGSGDLARWAAAYTAGGDADGYEIADGSGDVHDWFALLTPAERARDLAPGTSVEETLSDGGTAGFRITAAGALAALPPGTRAFAFDVVDGRLTARGPVAVGSPLAAGQVLAVVNPRPGSTSGTVALR
jgi:hypothetical protein